MYFGALIQLQDGTKKVVEADGPLGLFKFMSSIANYAKFENKLLKVQCDDPRALGMLEKQLKDQGTRVEYGVPGMLELELEK